MKLADFGGGWISFAAGEPVACEVGEPCALVVEVGRFAAEFHCRLGDGGEVDVSGDVLFARLGERIVSGAVI